MPAKNANIIAQLQKDIFPLQGFRPTVNGTAVDVGLGPIKDAFPNASFPVTAVHEFLYAGAEDAAATGGFVAGVVATLMRSSGVSLWISSSRTLFPPALKSFGVEPDKVIFVDLQKEKDVLWTMEEALRCGGLAAVIGEVQELSFTASRRLQLAVEQSQVTGFILRRNPRNPGTTACVTRWKITPLPSVLAEGMPGVGFPRWNVELLKVRNGKPGTWQIEWAAGRFRHISKITSIPLELQKKTG
ncbi:MAG: Error-prone repair protein ImuA [Chitinophagaceae bacterium]